MIISSELRKRLNIFSLVTALITGVLPTPFINVALAQDVQQVNDHGVDIDFEALAEAEKRVTEKLEAIAKVEGELVNGELVYDLGSMGAWMSNTMAIAGFAIGRHLGTVTLSPNMKASIKMDPGARRVMFGGVVAYVLCQQIQKYAEGKIRWRSAEKEELHRQLSYLKDRLENIQNGRELLEVDPIELLNLDENTQGQNE